MKHPTLLGGSKLERRKLFKKKLFRSLPHSDQLELAKIGETEKVYRFYSNRILTSFFLPSRGTKMFKLFKALEKFLGFPVLAFADAERQARRRFERVRF